MIVFCSMRAPMSKSFKCHSPTNMPLGRWSPREREAILSQRSSWLLLDSTRLMRGSEEQKTLGNYMCVITSWTEWDARREGVSSVYRGGYYGDRHGRIHGRMRVSARPGADVTRVGIMEINTNDEFACYWLSLFIAIIKCQSRRPDSCRRQHV